MPETDICVLNLLEESKGYDTALLTTFNFEIGFFERAVINRLLKNSIRKISLFVDAGELAKAINSERSTLIGQRYVINPVFMNSSYHPKVILLLGDRRARLIVGSGNLKTSGYYVNNEIFDCVDYNESHQETRSVIVAAIRFFLFSSSLSQNLDRHLLEEVQKKVYFRDASEFAKVRLIENSAISILEQVREAIAGDVRTIKIAVPYYDNELNGLSAVHSFFPNASVELYLQKGRSTFPKEIEKPFLFDIRVFDQVTIAGKPNGHFYHGKVFLFQAGSCDYVLYGSSNCTQSALTKSFGDSGNVECDLLVQGAPGEYDPFFEYFSIVDTSDPESHLMTYVSEKTGSFYFKYGVLDKNLTLYVGCRQFPSRMQVFYRGETVRWKRGDKELIVEIEADRVEETIVELQISSNNRLETIVCWYNNLSVIELFRSSFPAAASLSESQDFGEGDKYQEDIEKLLQEMGVCKEDYLQKQQEIRPFLLGKNNSEDEPEELSDSEDYIVNIDLTDEDYAAFRKYKIVECLRNRMAARYLEGSPWFFSADRKTASSGKTSAAEIKPVSKRAATSEEKRFAMLVRRCAKNAIDDSFIQELSNEHYLGLLAILFDVFEKYRSTEGMFHKEYVLRTRCGLLTKLFGKLHENEVSHELLSRAFGILLDNHLICEEYESIGTKSSLEQENRKTLLVIDGHSHIRNTYKDFLKADERLSPEEASIRIEDACAYIEHLFGYHDMDHIQERLRKRSGDMCGISLQEAVAKVLIISYEPAEFFSLDKVLIRDLVQYSLNVSKIDRIIIEVKNPRPKDKSSIVMIRHLIDLNYRRWSYVILRSNGERQEYPSRFLEY